MGELSAIPVWLCIPFAGLLLSIAVMPHQAGLVGKNISRWQLHSGQYLFIIPFLQRTMECLQ